jgi:hypothetical protein
MTRDTLSGVLLVGFGSRLILPGQDLADLLLLLQQGLGKTLQATAIIAGGTQLPALLLWNIPWVRVHMSLTVVRMRDLLMTYRS